MPGPAPGMMLLRRPLLNLVAIVSHHIFSR